jgi:hypothetical protein
MEFLKRVYPIAITLILLAGCNSSSQSSSNASPAAPSPTASESVASSQPSPSSSAPESNDANRFLIAAGGIGDAQLGMTLGALKQQLGSEAEFTVQSPFIVDFDAIAVRQAGEIQYYILYLAGQTLTDKDVIQGLYTDNSKFHTAEGVGPGTAIAKAEQAYGQATLSYNTQNESREYVRFERQPAPNISFGTGNGSATTAGIYASPQSEYNETQSYRDGATIKSVLVVCLTEGCNPPASSK